MVITSLAESALRELAHGIPADQLVPELARRIAQVEGVRVQVNRLAENRRREEARHRDALAAIGAELAEWQTQCPHPCPTVHHGGMPGEGYRQCTVCGMRLA